MSAYVCNATHIALLAIAAARWSKQWGDAPKVAGILARENLRSVQWRYSDVSEAAQDFLGESNDEFIAKCVKLAGDANVEFHPVAPNRLFGMADCTAYQSCECDDWLTTDAAAILNFIRLKAAEVIFERYKLETGWDFDASEIKTRNIVKLI